MNTLGYVLLSLLSVKPYTGYELVQIMQTASWQAKHSQIYPLLAKMEQEELLTFEHVEQIGKPNKKIYSISDKGVALLKQWITESPATPIIRDEFLMKMYAISLTDTETAKRLVQERLSTYKEKADSREAAIKSLEQENNENIKDITSKHFGRFIFFERRLRLEKEEISWCKWVLSLLEK
ncbi:PadR family transcriptional regulator [Bacillus gobiensis]|uniref:PadR family transcriptional regulator n=1 Tax=Bacillus gobiensis TaxID=1441095 RepID=UPI003D1EC33A